MFFFGRTTFLHINCFRFGNHSKVIMFNFLSCRWWWCEILWCVISEKWYIRIRIGKHEDYMMTHQIRSKSTVDNCLHKLLSKHVQMFALCRLSLFFGIPYFERVIHLFSCKIFWIFNAIFYPICCCAAKGRTIYDYQLALVQVVNEFFTDYHEGYKGEVL